MVWLHKGEFPVRKPQYPLKCDVEGHLYSHLGQLGHNLVVASPPLPIVYPYIMWYHEWWRSWKGPCAPWCWGWWAWWRYFEYNNAAFDGGRRGWRGRGGGWRRVLIFAIHVSKGHKCKLDVAVKGYRKKNDVLEHTRSRKSSVTHHDPQASLRPCMLHAGHSYIVSRELLAWSGIMRFSPQKRSDHLDLVGGEFQSTTPTQSIVQSASRQPHPFCWWRYCALESFSAVSRMLLDRLSVDVVHAAPFGLVHVGRTTDIDSVCVRLLDLCFFGSSIVIQHHSTQNMLLVIEDIIRIFEEDRGVGYGRHDHSFVRSFVQEQLNSNMPYSHFALLMERLISHLCAPGTRGAPSWYLWSVYLYKSI